MDGLCGCLNVRTRLSVASRRAFHFNPNRNPNPKPSNKSIFYAMADFFNLKARQQAAAQASSAKAPSTKQQPDRLQPWVEK